MSPIYSPIDMYSDTVLHCLMYIQARSVLNRVEYSYFFTYDLALMTKLEANEEYRRY